MIISNDSPNAWEIDYARLRREFQFVSDRNVQLTATWPEEIVTATGVAPISLDSAIRVLPQEAVSLAVEVHQGQREPFVPGELVITATANDAFTDLRAVDGTQARIAFVHSTSISLRVGPPANNREQSTIFRRQADQVKSKNPLEAIRLLQLATAADPSDTRSLLELGEAYLDAKQYRNSIPIFQRVAQGRRLSGHSSVPYLLALGHVGDGNEAEARRVLRAAGISEEGVESSIRRFRITVSR
jgi:hypothetical protein